MMARWAPLILIIGLSAPALSQVQTDIEPEAMARLEATAAYLSDAEQIQVRVETRTIVQSMNADREESGTLKLAIEHPNRLAINHREGDRRHIVIVDGDHYYEYTNITDRHTRRPAPPSIKSLFEQDPVATAGEPTLLARQRPLLQPLLSQRGLEYFEESFLVEAEYRGEEDLDGRPHHHLRLLVGDKRNPHGHLHWEMPIDLWIAAGDQPLPTRLVFDLTSMQGQQMGPDAGDARINAHFHDWQIDQAFDDESLFVFTPPEEAERAETIFEAPERVDPFAEFLGEPAPAFELELLNGGTMDLARHQKQDQIVILDFWATWCVPCIQAMPKLLAIQEQYAEKGVVLYAINQEEPAEQVRSFVEQQGWDLRVPMDADGSVSRQYQVRGIPHTVLIGPDGTVQRVHRGLTPNMKQELESEIEKLLDGQSLVE